MNETAQRDSPPRRRKITLRRNKHRDKKNSGRATFLAFVITADMFISLFWFGMDRLACPIRNRFSVGCTMLRPLSANFGYVLGGLGIVFAVITVAMFIITRNKRIPDFPRWVLITFQVLALIVGLITYVIARTF